MNHRIITTYLLCATLVMGQQKISERTTLAGASIDDAADWIPIVDMSETGAARDKKTSLGEFWKKLGGTNVSATELGYLDGVTSSLQTQISGKESSLGNPGTNGFVLSSTTAGTRSWIAPGGTWGSITGTLSSQTDLNSALAGKQTTAGAVWVTYASGARASFVPAADTDAARGDALEAAWASMLATAGPESIVLFPNNFAADKSTVTHIAVATQFVVEAGTMVFLNGARLYHTATENAAVMFGADAVDGWAFIGPGVIEGSAATSSGAAEIGINNRTCRRWLIENVTVRYFRGCGVQVNNSSYTSGDYSTLKVSTGKIHGCNIDLNNIGFQNLAGSEYIAVTNSTFNKNLTGCDIYAGNTKFSTCEASGNTNYALRIRNGGNDGHGCWNDGWITHNLNFGVHAEASMDAGFLFQGSVFGGDSGTTNKIESLGGGLTFNGCYIESPIYASATPTGRNAISNSFIAGTYTTTTDLSTAERLKWKMSGNYTLSGMWAQNDLQVYTYADNTAALAGGLVAGDEYRDSSGLVRVVY